MQGYRVSMEDSHRVVVEYPEMKGTGFFGVFDGHGGDQASKFCAEKMHERVQAISDRNFNSDTLAKALLDVDSEFLHESNPNRTHGSTCVFALINFDGYPGHSDSSVYTVTVSNSGDSRCLRGTLRDHAGDYTQVTEDHKPTDEVENARILNANGTVTNGRVDGDLSVSRAIGDWQFKTNADLTLAEQKVSPVPDIYNYTVQQGDWLLLACDGIYEQLNTEQVVQFINKSLRETKDPAVTASDLCMYSIEAGSKDNMTVVLLLFEDGSGYVPENCTNGFERTFIHSEIYPEDPSFMNAYKKFAVENGFENEVSSQVFAQAGGNDMADAPPILQLIAQLASGRGSAGGADLHIVPDQEISIEDEEEEPASEN